jgi:phosphonopyruvate decarboxylase
MNSIDPGIFVQNLVRLRRTFHTGVPCSFLRGLLIASEASPAVTYVAATSEAEAVGIASGAWLAGRKSVVMMQNSGFCDAINPLSSLAYPFRIPVLLIVSGRGAFGISDEPQHELIGRRMMDLLAAIEIPAKRILRDQKQLMSQLDEAETMLERTSLPVALVVERDVVGAGPAELVATERHAAPVEQEGNPVAADVRGRPGESTISRIRAIEEIRAALPDNAIFVATTGYTGRELYTLGDDVRNLYLVGSMGCASAVGLGLALNTDRLIVVLDGDGAALMRMGNIATLGRYQPSNLMHVILDNGQYESTGGQASASAGVSFTAVARACGYRRSEHCFTAGELRSALQSLKGQQGPNLIHVQVRPGTLAKLPRPHVSPREIAVRLREMLAPRTPSAPLLPGHELNEVVNCGRP